MQALDPTTIDLPAAMREWTGDAGASVAFEVSGSAAGVRTATELLGTRGRLVLVAIHTQPCEVDLFRFFWRELTLVGARVYQRDDFRRAVDLLDRGDIPADVLISQVVPIDEAAAAFAALERGGVVKVLIDCRPGPGNG